MAGVTNRAGEWRIFKSITFSREVDWGMTLSRISSPSAHHATKKLIGNASGSLAVTGETPNKRAFLRVGRWNPSPLSDCLTTISSSRSGYRNAVLAPVL